MIVSPDLPATGYVRKETFDDKEAIVWTDGSVEGKKREDKLLFSEFSLKRNGTFRKKHVFRARSRDSVLDMYMRGMLLNTMESQGRSGGKKKRSWWRKKLITTANDWDETVFLRFFYQFLRYSIFQNMIKKREVGIDLKQFDGWPLLNIIFYYSLSYVQNSRYFLQFSIALYNNILHCANLN